MGNSLHLSKSRFTCGLQCYRLLWWRVQEPDAPELIPDLGQQAIFDQGKRVGEVARTYVPGGQLVNLPHDAFGERVSLTRELLDLKVPAIYEASFLADDVYAAVDILKRERDGFRLIEVKSSTSLKDEHLPDVAIQLHVLRKSGLEVTRAEVMHLNRACAYPHLDNLFTRQDVTGDAEALQAGLPDLIAGQVRMLAGSLPEVPIGEHCAKPYECPFMTRCWEDTPENHVNTLYRVQRGGADLIARGFETIDRLPPGAGLSAIQERQRRSVQADRLIVEPGLARALKAFREPLAFLDFETVGLAVPVWNGCHPYDAVPVQFSCQRPAPDGTVVRHEWLADGPEDPRPELARRLVEACRGARTIVAYNASFERRGVELLAAAVPELAKELLEMAVRLADPLPVVRDHVYHPDFGGSFSLKAVLPALVPGSGYDELEVADGATASIELERLMFRGDSMPAENRQRLREALLLYCALDTAGLMKLLARLRELAGTGGPGP